MGEDDSNLYLETTQLDARDVDAGHVHVWAKELIARVNGIASLRDPMFEPIALTGRYDNPAGGTDAVIEVSPLNVRATTFGDGIVVKGEGQEPPQGPSIGEQAQANLTLAAIDSDVSEALGLLGGIKPLSWQDLYKVHEIIKVSVGGANHHLVELGWTTQREQSRFTASANRQDVSGPGARHARLPGDPPRDPPMTPAEAQAFVGRLMNRWLDHKKVLGTEQAGER